MRNKIVKTLDVVFLGDDTVREVFVSVDTKNENTKPRYQVLDYSNSGHCCFEASVIDTYNPIVFGEKTHYETMCETFSVEQATIICAALNAAERQNEKV